MRNDLSVKQIIDYRTNKIAHISILGIAICPCCFNKWMDKLSEKEKNIIKDSFCWVYTNDVVGWPDQILLFGKDITELDENKSIIEHKKDITLELTEMGILNNKDYTIFSENVEFLFGTLVDEDIEEELENDLDAE